MHILRDAHRDDKIVVSIWLQPTKRADNVDDFIEALNMKSDLKGEKRYETVLSLRIALTNNPVRWFC